MQSMLSRCWKGVDSVYCCWDRCSSPMLALFALVCLLNKRRVFCGKTKRGTWVLPDACWWCINFSAWAGLGCNAPVFTSTSTKCDKKKSVFMMLIYTKTQKRTQIKNMTCEVDVGWGLGTFRGDHLVWQWLIFFVLDHASLLHTTIPTSSILVHFARR